MQRFHSMPFGAEVAEDGVRFALWAPTAREVALVLGEKPHAMPAAESGWRRLTVPKARAGDRYRYRIDGGLMVPDPASRFQPDDITRAEPRRRCARLRLVGRCLDRTAVGRGGDL